MHKIKGYSGHAKGKAAHNKPPISLVNASIQWEVEGILQDHINSTHLLKEMYKATHKESSKDLPNEKIWVRLTFIMFSEINSSGIEVELIAEDNLLILFLLLSIKGVLSSGK